MKNHVIEPNSEVLISGKVHNGNMQDGKVMLVKDIDSVLHYRRVSL